MPTFQTPPALAKLEKKLANVVRVLDVVSHSVAEEFVNLIKQGFDTQTDPYGRRWRPKQRADGRKTLSGKTGRLKNFWHVEKVDSNGFLIASSVDYAAYHQAGTRNLPRRRMVPDPGRPMPRAWRETLEATALEALVEHFQQNTPDSPPTPPAPAAPVAPGAGPSAIAKSRAKAKQAKGAAAVATDAAATAPVPVDPVAPPPVAAQPAPAAAPAPRVRPPRKPRVPAVEVPSQPAALETPETAAAKPTAKAPRPKSTKPRKPRKAPTAKPASSKPRKAQPKSGSTSKRRSRGRYRGSKPSDRDSTYQPRYRPRGGGGGKRGGGFTIGTPMPSLSVMPQFSWRRRVRSALRRKKDDE